jgi:hypothetical protein
MLLTFPTLVMMMRRLGAPFSPLVTERSTKSEFITIFRDVIPCSCSHPKTTTGTGMDIYKILVCKAVTA